MHVDKRRKELRQRSRRQGSVMVFKRDEAEGSGWTAEEETGLVWSVCRLPSQPTEHSAVWAVWAGASGLWPVAPPQPLVAARGS